MLSVFSSLFAFLLFVYYWMVHSIKKNIFNGFNKKKTITDQFTFNKVQKHSSYLNILKVIAIINVYDIYFKGHYTEDLTALISQLDLDKQLYHQLQNLEHYPEALHVAYNRLLSLFDFTIDSARTSSSRNILNAVPTFSSAALTKFLDDEYFDVTVGYKKYLERRQNGGSRELFPDVTYAKYWLRTVAPVKYVDGAWIGGIHRTTTNMMYRSFTKTLWQILSEELGDGDLQKNHVWVYRQLLESIDANDIGRGDSKDFISSFRNANNDVRVWTGAIAQLCISLFPDMFLPEILGFNMSYESLPLHLLITIYELRELNIDPYYFVLHVSIDNKHSGHAAMGVNSVITYITSLPVVEQSTAWKRIQAGFLLASELPTTPIPYSDLDKSLEKIFGEKSIAAHSIHASCLGKIGGRTGMKLNDWLDPLLYPNHSLTFLRTLADSQWIVRGEPERSKLVREMKWGGRMFGAFTSQEVSILQAWIRHLTQYEIPMERTKSYETFTDVEIKLPDTSLTLNFNSILTRPSAPRCSNVHLEPISSLVLLSSEEKTDAILSLLSISAIPFEYISSLPAKCASSYGMMAIRCLRALYGFLPESDICAGMYEVTSNQPTYGVIEIASISLENISECVRQFAAQLLCISAHPEQNEAILVGIQHGFIEYVFQACEEIHLLSSTDLMNLFNIRRRCRKALDLYIEEKNADSHWLTDMFKGKKIVQDSVYNIIN
uniref:ATPase-like protein n=1 Tax=Adineta vaga TaxID=104782 RepID=B3G436_ADIVA|nr:ATPase-like protein [Adineta vaga]